MNTNFSDFSDIRICDYSIEEYEQIIEKFHGNKAPGLLIGGFMVDLARKNLPAGQFFDVICESAKCLPDAVQVLTPCSIGNGWLKIIDIGRFALTFFDKHNGNGVRVYLDTEKVKKFPEVYHWFFKIIPKQEQNTSVLLNQIRSAGTELLSFQKVKVNTAPFKKEKGSTVVICPKCGESYPAKDGKMCRVCSGEINYMAD